MTDARGHTIGWPGAIALNRDALLRIVAVLFVYAGLDEGGAEALPRHAWRKILRLLRPAESAVRRLIVIAARGIAIQPPVRRAADAPPSAIERLQAAGLLVIRDGVDLGLARAPQTVAARPQKSASVIPAFRLTDAPRRFDTRSWDGKRPFPQEGFALADPDEEVAATRLCNRLLALKSALDDLPGHANRLARWKARRDAGIPRARRISPLRPGHPPGHRNQAVHAVDDVLRECHSLSIHAQRLDTS